MATAIRSYRTYILIATGFLTVSAASADPIIYEVAVDTSSISGSAGSLDFTFNPGPLTTQFASLEILDFASDGSLADCAANIQGFCPTGDVSGQLPGTVTFDNGAGFNDYFDDFTFGTTISFDLSLYGPALSTPDGVSTSGSTFAFSMFSDDLGTIPTLTIDTTDGFAFTVDVNLDGTTTVTHSSARTTIIATPEPGALAEMVIAAALCIAFRVLLRRRQTPGRRLRFSGLALLIVSSAVPNVSAQVAASITDLGTLGGSTSVATAINASGQVVGYSSSPGDTNIQAFFYPNGGPMKPIPTLGGSSSFAWAINAGGQVVGQSNVTQLNGPNGGQLVHAFLYSNLNGSVTDIGAVVGGPTDSVAHGINDNGQVVGVSDFTCLCGVETAFLYSGGSMSKIDIGFPSVRFSSNDSVAYGINNNGEIVGYNHAAQPAIFSGGNGAPIDNLASGSALYVNASGQIIGNRGFPGASGAFLYSDGNLTNIPTLGGSYSGAYGLNDSGQVVGSASLPGNTVYHAFQYSSSTGIMTDLNSLLPANSGWVLQSAAAINNSGQIAGYGTTNGRTHAFLFTPCPVSVTLSFPDIQLPSIAIPQGHTYIQATFAPPGTLQTYAAACGFNSFNWQQMITVDPGGETGIIPNKPWNLPYNELPAYCSALGPSQWPPSLCSLVAGPPSMTGLWTAYPAYGDPPQGGFVYLGSGYDPYPFVYLSSALTPTSGVCTVKDKSHRATPGDLCPDVFPYVVSADDKALSFVDAPAHPSLQGVPAATNPPAGSFLGFLTSLVGVDAQGQAHPLFSWAWNSTYNGTSGGLPQTAGGYMIDPGSGAGGITITSINGTQLPTALAPSQIATTASGLAYSRVTQTFNGTVTIKNVSANSITAPLQLVLTGISAGVTLSDATNDLSGTPYLTIPGVNGLAPGNSLVVNVRFKNPSNTIIKFQPLVYSGAIN